MEPEYLLIQSISKSKGQGVDSKGNVHALSMSPKQYLEKACIENGSTMQGRCTAFQKLTHTVQKPAVCISERSQILYFPTMSWKKKDCIWICYNEVLRIKSNKDGTSQILFASGYKTIVPFDARILKNQMERCQRFLEVLNESTLGIKSPNQRLSAIIKRGNSNG